MNSPGNYSITRKCCSMTIVNAQKMFVISENARRTSGIMPQAGQACDGGQVLK